MRSFSLLRKLDLSDLVIYTITFLMFFSIGILGGKPFEKISLFQSLTNKNHSDNPPAMIKNGQRNLLVIEVDSFSSSEPRLKSVWILISLHETQNLTLIPLYPRIESGSVFADPSISQAFKLTSQGHPSPKFFEELNQQIWWDNYLLIDEVGVTRVLETLNDKVNSDQEAIITMTYPEIPPVWLNPESALQGQRTLIEATCTLLGKLPGSTNIGSIIKYTDTHILTDLELNNKIHKDIFDHQEIHPLVCEFPTLTFDTP